MPEVLWSCRECGITKRSFNARERGDSEDIAIWMQTAVTFPIMHDHRKQSPLCDAKTISEVRIRLPADGGRIGGETKN